MIGRAIPSRAGVPASAPRAGSWAAAALAVIVVGAGVVPEPVQPSSDPVLVGAGDIAGCNVNGDEATAALLDDIPGTVFTAGDGAYPDGTIEDYRECYEPSWGRHRERTRPTAGNHEWHDAGAAGYFEYFAGILDPGEHWYSFDLGAWHVVALESECGEVGGCEADSPQVEWLRQDLASTARSCIAAIWHVPRYSSSEHENEDDFVPIWEVLYEAGADVVLNGHDHVYERFGKQDPHANADPNGIRQFTVGTGGRGLYDFVNVQPNSEARINDTFGVLKLILRDGSYDWSFIATDGSVRDQGSDGCNGGGGGGGILRTYLPTADTMLREDAPDVPFGSWPTLTVAREPASEALLRFEPADVRSYRTTATLRVPVLDGSRSGISVAATHADWGEHEVTWRSRPPPAGDAGVSGPVANDAWAEFDVTGSVRAGRPVAFLISAVGDDAASVPAREQQGRLAELIVREFMPQPNPVDTAITFGPSDPSTDSNARFMLAGSSENATFECRLDAGAWHACASPVVYRNVARGEHVFEARATDPARGTDATPASWTWTASTHG